VLLAFGELFPLHVPALFWVEVFKNNEHVAVVLYVDDYLSLVKVVTERKDKRRNQKQRAVNM